MKSFFLASLLVVATSASLLGEHGEKFQAFKSAHGKIYKNQVEESIRFAIFRDNLRAIEEHNALYEQGLVSYKQAITPFADLTQEEFKARLGLHKRPILTNTVKYVKKGVAVPKSVDWRKSQVTPVKDQGDCGSCWAFSLTGSTEAAYQRAFGKLVSLSEQQLVDCATDINDGCDGGYLEQTFPYIESNGLVSEKDYPYKAREGKCKYDASKVVARVSDHVTIIKDEEALLEAVATVGPVSIAMDATYLSAYSSGIYEDKQCTTQELNHGVLVVGYGSENGKDYWIVKNSWGKNWGAGGFFKIARGKNMCGVAEDNTYPIIN